MSDLNRDEVQAPKPFTIRLTVEDQVALAQLCRHYGLNRPNSVRRALRAALLPVQSEEQARPPFSPSGSFIPALGGENAASFPIRLKRKAADER